MSVINDAFKIKSFDTNLLKGNVVVRKKTLDFK